MKTRILLSASALALVAGTAASIAMDYRGGNSAFGDWHGDTPGLMRKIEAGDVAKPGATPSAANRSKVVPRPGDAQIKTMPGFTVSDFATGLEGARVIRIAPNGDVFVSQSMPSGSVTVLRPSKDGKVESKETFVTGLTRAYGIAFYPPGPNPKYVYIGMEGKVVRLPYKNGDMKATGPAEDIVTDLKIGGGHWTRDVSFTPDGKLMYVAVGSGSNIAEEMSPRPADLKAWEKAPHSLGSTWGAKEDWRANVLTYTPDGKNKQVYAAGIRNCSGLTVQPGTGTVFCATNERDLLGDNTPPDYVTSVKKGGYYGWPWYYIGANEDTRPDGGARPDLKGKAIVPDVLLQPHSAPLGLSFNPGGMFPAEWKGDAFVAMHGSWNRSLHTGYKIVRLPFKNNKATGEYQDFVLGFTAPSGEENVWGRPVDTQFMHDGSLLFSDDANGVIYRVTYSKDKVAAAEDTGAKKN